MLVDKAEKLPNFLVAGTARSGTTSLFYYLRQHPDISFAAKKEPKFFSSLPQKYPHNGIADCTVDEGVIKDFNVYRNLFVDLNTKMIGEASSDYLFFHEATAASIYQFLGDIPIILCLRNPVDRAFSAYNNLIRDQREFLTFDDALKAENSRFDDNWDWMWAYKRGGLYYEQVKSYKKQFSKIEIILFDDFETNPSLVVKNVFSFLGVDPEVTVATGSRYSHSGRPNNRLLAFFASRSNPIIFLFRKLLLLIFPRSLIEKIAARSLTKNEIDPNTREELNVFFRDDIEKLESLLNISLDRWK